MKSSILLTSVIALSSMQCYADQSAYLQSLINSGQDIPAGYYTITQALSKMSAGRIRGAGPQATIIYQQFPNGILIQTEQPVTIEDLSIVNQATGGACITVSSVTGNPNIGSSFHRVWLWNVYDGFVFDQANTWTMDECRVLGVTNFGVFIQNTLNWDDGDSTIDDCLFAATPSASNILVKQVSADGLRIENSKFNGGAWGFVLQTLDDHQGDLLIKDCSLENATYSEITVIGPFRDVVIQGNETQQSIFPFMLVNVQNASVTGNTIDNFVSTAGILGMFSTGVVSGNTVSSLPGGPAISCDGMQVGMNAVTQ